MKFQIGAMTFGDILDRGLKILLSRLGVYYAINLLVLAPLIVIQVFMPALVYSTGNVIFGALLSLVALVLLLVLQPIGSAAILRIISQEFIDQSVSLGDALRFAMTRFGSLLGTSILASLMIFVGLLLFVVPGVIFMLNYSLIAQIVVVEGLSGQPALNRSKDLVAGWRGRVFGIILLIGIVNFAVGYVFGLVLPDAGVVRNAQGILVPQFSIVNSLIKNLGLELIQILLSTYSAICITLIYYDLRIRKEGYDLELAARQESKPTEAL
jgi:hypothetical protein